MLKELARKFLEIADEKNVLVSAYFNGCNEPECAKAYNEVKEAEQAFLNVWNKIYDENREPCLDYELAEYCAD